MPRVKMERNLTLKPNITRFIPEGGSEAESIKMTHDELEALYLMDFKEQYQEECAKSLGVSRPTFSRIVHSARKKIAEMLVLGKTLEIIEELLPYIVSFATEDRVHVATDPILARFFALARVEDGKISSIKYVENPIRQMLEREGREPPSDSSGLGAGRIIPPILKDSRLFICREIGEGLRRNLEGIGMVVVQGDYMNLNDIEKLI